MRKLALYAALLVAAVIYPSEGTDVGKLLPVETVSLFIEENEIIIETDTDNRGEGESVDAALQNLKDTTAGLIYLDTADYLLVRKDTEELIPQIAKYLKGSVRICYVQRAVDIAEAASFLSVHTPKIKLRDWDSNTPLQTLKIHGEHLILDSKK